MTQSTSTIKVAKIAKLGEPILRAKAEAVTEVKSPEIQALIQSMLVTVAQAGGVGIAAPQIFHNKRIFIMCSKPNERYPSAPEMEPTAIINPEILSTSQVSIKDWEGCLSVPNMRGLVPRYESIKVRYITESGKQVTRDFTGFLARIFQHELDHLDGLTFVDRVESNLDLYNEEVWREQILNKT